MADKDDDILDLDDPNPGVDDPDLAFAEKLMENWGEDDDEEDTGGFDQPLGEDDLPVQEKVDFEEGLETASRGRDKRASARRDESEKDDAAVDGSEEKAAPADPAAKAQAEKGEGEKPKAPVSADDEAFAKAIGGLPESVRTRIETDREELGGFRKAMEGRRPELLNGMAPAQAFDVLLNLQEAAVTQPAQYAGWFLNQSTGGDPEKMKALLTDAAKTQGLTISFGEAAPDDDDEDDDPFMSDSERAARKELRELRAAQQAGQQAPSYDPVAAAQSKRDVLSVLQETGPDGRAVRPHAEKLHDQMLAHAQRIRAANPTMPMRDLIAEAYDAAELADPETRKDALARLANTSAAPAPENVAQGGQGEGTVRNRARDASQKLMGSNGDASPAAESAGQGVELKTEADMRAFLADRMR